MTTMMGMIGSGDKTVLLKISGVLLVMGVFLYVCYVCELLPNALNLFHDGGENDRDAAINERTITNMNDRKRFYTEETGRLAGLHDTDDIRHNISYHKQLYELYKDGVPDVYDRNNNKIKGVHPDPSTAVHHLNEMIRYGGVEGYYLLARLYHYGIHTFQPNIESAKEYYTLIIENDYPNKEDAIRELSYIYSNESTEYKRKVMEWLHLSKRVAGTKPSNDANRVKLIRPKSGSGSGPGTGTTTSTTLDEPIQVRSGSLGKVYREMKSDSQNVHDHMLVKSVNDTVKRLKSTTDMTVSLEDSLGNLRSRIGGQPNSDKKTDALRTLDAIERNHMELLAYNMKETELLHILWNRIVNNHDDSPDLKDNLYEQLSDSVEHDSVVCSSGRFTRLLDSLNVVDPDVTIKSKEVIHRELMDKSAHIRDSMYKQCSEEEQEDLDSPELSNFSVRFDERLRNELRKQFKKDYVDTELMSQSELDSELSVWIQYV